MKQDGAALQRFHCDIKMVDRESFRVRTLQLYVDNGGKWQMSAHQSPPPGH